MLKINNASVYELVHSALSDDEFTGLCQGHFSEVYGSFTTGQDRPARIRKLVEFAFRRRIPSKLLSDVRRINDAVYGEFTSRLVENDDTENHQAAPLVGALPVVTSFLPLLGRLLLADLNVNDAFFQSLPEFSDETFPLVSDSGLLLCECVNKLAPLPAQHQDGEFPLLRFVSLLSEEIDDPTVANALKDWGRQAAEQLVGDSARTEQQRQALERNTSQPNWPVTCRLIIHLEELESDRYLAKVWVRGTARDFCLIEDEVLDRIDEFPGLLDQLRAKLAGHNIARENTEVEFFLPRHLMSIEADQWMILDEADFDISLPLGCDYTVVVRSLERARSRAAQFELESRWQTLTKTDGCCSVACSFDEATDENSVLLITEEILDLVQFRTELRLATVVMCALIGHPISVLTRESPTVFNALLAEGVPGALWLREHPDDDSDAASSELNQLVENQPLVELPHRLKQRRLQAVGLGDLDAWHPGRHLALMWDDPTKPHPDYEPEAQLVSPYST